MPELDKDNQRFLDSVDLSSTKPPQEKEPKSPSLVELMQEGIKALWEKIFGGKIVN